MTSGEMVSSPFSKAADATAWGAPVVRIGLAAIALACTASMLLYLAAFLFVFHKPLTIETIGQYLSYKQAYLAGLPGRKIVILAGSNGRFGHRCRLIAARTQTGCANMSISADISVEYQLGKIRRYLSAGDILYLPLEYRAKLAPVVGIEGPYAVAYDKAALVRMPPEQFVNSLFYFDLPFLLSSAGEMVLAAAHHEARYSVGTLDANGDESGHSESKAAEFRRHLRETAPIVVDARATMDGLERSAVLNEFLRWAAANGVAVVGGLPTTFENTPIPAGLVEDLRGFYASRGHCFIALENLSLYPRTAFLDTPYHLAEQAQIRHSEMLAPYFLEMLRSPGRCPA